MKNSSNQIYAWYQINKRALPWRKTKNPYAIWLSEIMLQQTRVDQGIPYYLKFIKAYSDVHKLANAPEDEVMKLWQGLGYYSRARNLHRAAKIVSNDLNGVFPNDFLGLKKLPGVGDYTAAAIASISFDIRVPVVDGNVYRVLSRLFNINSIISTSQVKKQFFDKALKFMGNHDPGDFNQAMMEFGAIQCVPKNPNCSSCPVNDNCQAFKLNKVAELPNNPKKKPLKNRYINYFFVHNQLETIVQKRTGSGIWKSLFEFPMVESFDPIKDKDLPISKFDEKFEMTHLLTHQRIYIKFFVIKKKVLPNIEAHQQLIKLSDLEKLAIPKPLEKFIAQLHKSSAHIFK